MFEKPHLPNSMLQQILFEQFRMPVETCIIARVLDHKIYNSLVSKVEVFLIFSLHCSNNICN